jgi:hypothetical protein
MVFFLRPNGDAKPFESISIELWLANQPPTESISVNNYQSLSRTLTEFVLAVHRSAPTITMRRIAAENRAYRELSQSGK